MALPLTLQTPRRLWAWGAHPRRTAALGVDIEPNVRWGPTLAEEAEQKRLAEEAEQKRLAEEAEQKRLAEETKQKQLAEGAEQKRLAEKEEQQQLAEEAKQKQLAEVPNKTEVAVTNNENIITDVNNKKSSGITGLIIYFLKVFLIVIGLFIFLGIIIFKSIKGSRSKAAG